MKIPLSDHFTYGKLVRFVMPSIVMMIVTSVYGVVDGLFVSNYAGKIPFAAINLIMPYIMAFGCFGFMLGTGGTALISKTLGMGDREKANELFSMVTWVGIAIGIGLSVIGLVFLRPVAEAMGATGEMLDCCMRYGGIVIPTETAFIFQFAFQNYCVTAEKSNLSLVMTIVSGVCNILMDALFVAVFQWGLEGAAFATAISQIIGALIPLIYFSRPNSSLLRLGKFRFDAKAMLRIFTNGSSELMSNLSLSVVNGLYNLQLLKYAGENGIAAYGVIMYVNIVFLSVSIGFSIGSAPIIGFNFGAENTKELKNVVRKSVVFLIVSSVSMVLSALLLARPLSYIFVGYDEVLMEMTVRGFLIYSFSFLMSGFNIFTSSMFTALNNGLISAFIAFVRTLICQIVFVMVLPTFWGLDGIWISVLAAELASMLLSVICLMKYQKRYHY